MIHQKILLKLNIASTILLILFGFRSLAYSVGGPGVFVDDTAPVIILIGNSEVLHSAGSEYIDAGATATDNIDGDLTSNIVVNNPVNGNVPNTYSVTYNVTDSAGNIAIPINRTVTVVDTTPPTITLNGSAVVTHAAGNSYLDAGATATDNIDGDIAENILVNNPVDSNTPGTYTISYNISDLSGNAADEVTRTVHVILETPTYTVSFSAGSHGSLTGATSQTITSGDDCTPVTAVPETNYHFVNWTGSGFTASTDNPLTIRNVSSNLNVTANFAVDTHTVVFAAGSNGSVSGSTTQVVNHGGSITSVTAIPNPYYVFVNWTGDYSGTTNPLVLTNVTQDMTITANFDQADNDNDGVPSIEEMGPNGDNALYDGNNDGIADAMQDNVSSFFTLNEYGVYLYVTMAASVSNNSVTMNINHNPDDPLAIGGIPTEGGEEVDFPYGFFEFTVTCKDCNANPGGFTPTVTLYLPEDVAPNTYHKYGPTPNNELNHWYKFMYDVLIGVGAEINDNIITLHFIDGDTGDDDLDDENGIIVDIGGPGIW